MDEIVQLLEDFGHDRDSLIDELQEWEPDELKVLCENSWALELILAYCKSRTPDED